MKIKALATSLHAAMTANGWFTEKGAQIDTYYVKAFGIQLESRYAKAKEMREMLHFAELIAKAGAAHWVKEVNYESKSQTCSFVFNGGVIESDVATAVFNAAKESISSFFWIDGHIYNKGED